MDVVVVAPFATTVDDVADYFASLSEREKVGFQVAQEQLGVTFDVTKTRGFLAWKASSRKRKAES
jgi:hypothetical protein